MRNAILVVLLASAGYIIPAYFLQRDDIGLQLLFFGIEFALYLWCIKKLQISTVAAIALCVVPRLVWIAFEPQMSDDYYRFYWDGQLVSNGMDPYAETPTQLQKQETEGLPNVFTQLNSPNYYSSYPPFHQFLFFVAASCGSLKSFIITTRILLILADVLILFLIARLAANKKLTFNPVWAYGLNPLVITELTGNLHFEGVCMALWLLAVWWMFSNKNVLSVITWGLA